MTEYFHQNAVLLQNKNCMYKAGIYNIIYCITVYSENKLIVYKSSPKLKGMSR